jgi:putative ABC transport system permease protein
MQTKIIFLSALRSLKNHPVRTVLTTIGIIIGVVSIIFVMSIGEGAKTKIKKEIEKIGSNFIIALSVTQKKMSARSMGINQPIFTEKDYNIIKDQAEYIEMVSRGGIKPKKIIYKNLSWNTSVAGVDANYLDIRNWDLNDGSFFTEYDVHRSSNVVVIGKTIVLEVFKGKNPIGETIRIKNLLCKVTGVLEERGKRPDGSDEDDLILLPITTFLKRISKKKKKFFVLTMSAKDKDYMGLAAEEVRSILRQNHNIKTEQDETFTIFSQDDMHQATDAATKVLNLLLLLVASISLIVGGIGIMNIMLVTVTERTREIGIRMALGATKQNILHQFIIESIVISIIGGLFGIFLGILAAKGIQWAFAWAITIPLTSIFVSFFSCVCIGVFFGFYPANKASKLNPIEALIKH